MRPGDFDFRNPDYAAVWKMRLAAIEKMRADPGCIPDLKGYYRENPADFIDDWGVTFDPRLVEIGLPGVIPMVLFDKQREMIDWIIRKWRAREPGLLEKSRDCGASYVAIELGCTLCTLYDGMAIGMGSRKAEYVDKIEEPKSLFWKARLFMANVPVEFRAGWEAWRDAPHMRMNFPATGSKMTGESGDQIGRGDRAGIYFVDEAQPLDARIVTPDGYASMADIGPDRVVIGRDGRPQRVTHVNDCGVHDVFRVTFSDGTSTECSPNHLWTVDKVWGARKTQTLRTHELAERYRYESPGGQVQYRYRVPVCDPVTFAEQCPLPLDPYVVGALLGDGSTKGGVVRITSTDADVIAQIAALLPSGVIIGAFDGRYTYNIVDRLGRRGRGPGGVYIRSRARVAIAEAGIAGLGAADKFVPDAYKFASPTDRLSLLQGLLDTDGSATGGAASFYTSSRRLAEDVRFIVQSMGGTATHNVKPDYRGYKDIHAVHVALPRGMKPFRLRRKLAALKTRKHPADRAIVGIEHVGRRPVRCITVEGRDGLYLTDNFIVTHNSAHLERPKLIEASLSQTTNCRIDMSSVNGMANPFAEKRHGGKIDVFVFDWRDDPRKDAAWYEKQQRELDPVILAQEVDRDYSASVAGIVLPGAWVRACIDAHVKLGIKPSGQRGIALDVADEGPDKNAAVGGQGVIVDIIEEWSGKGSDTFATAQRAFDLCDEHEATMIRYDSDGLGAFVRGDARIINDRRSVNGQKVVQVEAFRGSAGVHRPDAEDVKGRKNKDYFANWKAQSWWSLRTRVQKTYRWIVEGVGCDPDEIISISAKAPNYLRLVAELSQPTYDQNTVGKLLIDKTPDGMKSPNLADGCMMRFASVGSALAISDEVLKRAASGGNPMGRLAAGGYRRKHRF